MSVSSGITHKVQAGETLASLVEDYRLSSIVAILENGKNAALKSQLSVTGELPPDLLIHIPPNAGDVLKERMHKLSELKMLLSAHFDNLEEMTSAVLQPTLMNDTSPFHSDEVTTVLNDLNEFSQQSIDRIAAEARRFAELGSVMTLTHVATSDDCTLAASAAYPMAGLTWAISSAGLSSWQSMWMRELWESKWDSATPEAAEHSTRQYITSVRSIVVQHVDRRFRESLMLQQQLQSER